MIDKKALIHKQSLIYGNFLKMNLLSESDCTDISTDNCQVLIAAVGLNPTSNQYGELLGIFQYKKANIYQFWYHIHRPNQKTSKLSNKMTNLDELKEMIYQIDGKNMTFVEPKPTTFGQKAFLEYIQPKDLSGEDFDLHMLMKNITAYSRLQDYCKQLRKTDKQYLEYQKKQTQFTPQ